MTRDSQKGRVYAAERTVDHGSKFETLEGLARFANKVYHSEFWRYHFGPPRFASLRVERGRGGTAKSYSNGRLTFGTAAQDKLTALHELAHQAVRTSHTKGIAGHGPEFVQAYLKLVRRYGDPGQADALREAFRTKKVRCSRSTPYRVRSILLDAERIANWHMREAHSEPRVLVSEDKS